MLQTNNFAIPYNRMITKTQPIPTGTSYIEFDNVSQGKVPDMLISDMVSDTALSGGYQANTVHFQNFDAT